MEGFDEFYGATQARVVRAVALVTGSREEAQDCVQEAYVRAASRWTQVRKADSPEAWVRRVALNLALDGHRHRGVRQRWLRRVRSVDPAPGPQEHVLDVVRALRSLPRAQQEVVVLHHLMDLTVADVARELQRSENTVKTQLVRARAALSGLLALDEEVLTRD